MGAFPKGAVHARPPLGSSPAASAFLHLPAPSHGLSLQCRHLSSHPPGLAGREAWSPGQRAAWPGRSRDPCGQSACRRRNPGCEVTGPLRPHADGPWRRAPPARAAPPHVRPSASVLAHARLPSLQGLRTRPPAPGPSPRLGAPSRCAVRSGLRCQWVPGRPVPRVPWPCDPDAWLGERPLFKRTEGQVWHVDTVRTSALSVSPQSSAAAGPRPCCPWEGGSPGGAGSAGQEGAAEGALLWGCGLPRRPEAAASAPWSPMCSPQWHEHHAVALPRGGRARQAPAAAEPPPPHTLPARGHGSVVGCICRGPKPGRGERPACPAVLGAETWRAWHNPPPQRSTPHSEGNKGIKPPGRAGGRGVGTGKPGAAGERQSRRASGRPRGRDPRTWAQRWGCAWRWPPLQPTSRGRTPERRCGRLQTLQSQRALRRFYLRLMSKPVNARKTYLHPGNGECHPLTRPLNGDGFK